MFGCAVSDFEYIVSIASQLFSSDSEKKADTHPLSRPWSTLNMWYHCFESGGDNQSAGTIRSDFIISISRWWFTRCWNLKARNGAAKRLPSLLTRKGSSSGINEILIDEFLAHLSMLLNFTEFAVKSSLRQ
jgi:hypothetical protein